MVRISIENPNTSYFWQVLARLAQEWTKEEQLQFKQLLSVIFSQCMHGGRRPKTSKFLANVPHLQALALMCDNQHDHDPWNISWSAQGWTFATHLEAEYPRLLCKRLVEQFCQSLPSASMEALLPVAPMHATSLAALGLQSKKSPPLLSEFKVVLLLPEKAVIPPKSKIILTGVGSGSSPLASACARTGGFSKVGVYREPEKFLAEACKLKHPADVQNPIAQVTREALDTLFSEDHKFVMLKRKTNLLKCKILSRGILEGEYA